MSQAVPARSRKAGSTTIRVTARMLATNLYERENAPPIEVGVVGGSAQQRPTTPTSIDVPSPTGHAVWSYAYPEREISLPLSDSGSDIVVRVSVPSPFFPRCVPLCAPVQAVLLDELKVE